MSIIPVLVMLITFVLVKKQANVFSSKARISAGIVDASQQLFLNKEDFADNKVTQSFSNLLQMLQLKTVLNQVAYLLILHDLTSAEPYRKPSKLLSDLTPSARKHAVEVYTKLYNNRQLLDMMDKDQEGLFKVIKSMKYDDESIKNKYKVYRVESSDFIDLEFDSENPYLSAFVINSICKEFIAYYTILTKQNELNALNFVSDLLRKKKDSLDAKNAHLMNYKIQNNILDLDEEAKSLYSQISELETKLQMAQNEIIANRGAIENIEHSFNKQEKQEIDNKVLLINKDIVSIKERLNKLNDEYIKYNFDKSIKQRIDSLREYLSSKINQSTDKHSVNSTSAKDGLVSQKLKLEVDLALAQSSIKSFQEMINRLKQRVTDLVPNEAILKSFEDDINMASQEYTELLKKYNQVSLEYNNTIRLKQIEFGIPGEVQPSKKIIMVIMSGLVSFVIYFVILFVLFYLDDSIKEANDLERITDLKVLGFIPLIKNASLDIHKLWEKNGANTIDKEFRNLLRSTRFEIHNALRGGRVLVVTSLGKGEGKTLFALSMASAYQMIGKKVLLIDGNIISPEITEIAKPDFFIEDYLNGILSLDAIQDSDSFVIMGNKLEDTTLFEMQTEGMIKQKILELKDVFDIVIIESSSLDTLNESKEWIEIADSVLAVFEANKGINAKMKENIEYLRSLDKKFIGWVLNKVTLIDYEVTEGRKRRL